ncbi:MAG: class I SAM-dependent methyltransferase [Deltaproteobacteria bacterium]|nr:class I SAM-dependent methyltransferase [Deltaproteobacteria bacterium]
MTEPTRDTSRAPLAHRILYRDPDLLVIDKPAGLAVDAPEREDDLARRVRALHPGYVGIVHRAERDSSGICVFSLRREANAWLSPQLDQRTAPRTVFALIDSQLRRTTASQALRNARVMASHKSLSLVALTLERDKLAALAESLSPALIAPLHLQKLTLTRPSGPPLTLTAPTPWSLSRQVSPPPQTPEAWAQCLREGLWRRDVLAQAPDTDAYRLAHGLADAIADVSVDLYGDFAVVHVFEPLAPDTLSALYQAVASAYRVRGVYVKHRRKQSNTLVDTRRDEVAPSAPVWGEAHPEPMTIVENGVRYVVRLGDGLSTGIFLDQRRNRAWLRANSAGKSLLNLFAYTGAFTVAAAAGGASRSVSVDASRGSLAWLVDHLAANGLADTPHLRVCAEVFGWLDGAHARGDQYDLVLCDPPSYSHAKDGPRFSSAQDWPELAAKCFAVCAPNATLLATSNHRGISPRKFRTMILEGARLAKREVVAIEGEDHCGAGDDFANTPDEAVALKAQRVRVR